MQWWFTQADLLIQFNNLLVYHDLRIGGDLQLYEAPNSAHCTMKGEHELAGPSLFFLQLLAIFSTGQIFSQEIQCLDMLRSCASSRCNYTKRSLVDKAD